MIVTSFTVLGDFGICLGHSPSAGSFHHPNTGNLTCNLFLYVVKGGATANGRLVQIGANDLSDFVGAPIDYEFAEEGVTWMAVNVTDGANSSCFELPAGQHTIEGGDRKYVAVLLGQITANDKVIPELKFARIKEGKQVVVQVPPGSVAVVLTARPSVD
jgi:hypothetical protein